MSKNQKGRKHRKVNTTPRPTAGVLRARAEARAAARMPQAASAAMLPSAREELVAEALAAMPGAAAVVPSAPAEATVVVEAQEPGPVFGKAADGGLGLPAHRTWSHLKGMGAQGVSVAELAEVVGLTAGTVSKHLKGLSKFGLVAEAGAGRWAGTDKGQWEAAREHGLAGHGAKAAAAV